MIALATTVLRKLARDTARRFAIVVMALATLGGTMVVSLVLSPDSFRAEAQTVGDGRAVRILSLSANGDVSSGTGFLVAGRSTFVTNRHVVDDGLMIRVLYRQNDIIRTIPARVVHIFREQADDLAVLETQEPTDVERLTLVAQQPGSGFPVTAVGFPISADLFETRRLDFVSPTVSRGIVSRQLGNNLQHDASINGGNSGGPLLDACNQVVGVNTFSVSGNVQGIFVAISSTRLIDRLRSLDIAPRVSATACGGGLLDLVTGPDVLRNLLLLLVPLALAGWWLLQGRPTGDLPAKAKQMWPFGANGNGQGSEAGVFASAATSGVGPSHQSDHASAFQSVSHSKPSESHAAASFDNSTDQQFDDASPEGGAARLATKNKVPTGFVRLSDGKAVDSIFMFSEFPEQGVAIGRDSGLNQIVIEHPSVSRQHAVMQLKGAAKNEPQVVLLDLGSSNGTRVNNELITDEALVPEHSTVKFGQVEMNVDIEGMFQDPQQPETITDIHRKYGRSSQRDDRFSNSVFYNNSGWQLSGLDETGTVLHIVLNPDPKSEKQIILGRAGADFDLNHGSVSRKHAVVTMKPGLPPTIADLGSTNGTRVDGEEVGAEPRTLYNANLVELGELGLQLSVLAV